MVKFRLFILSVLSVSAILRCDYYPDSKSEGDSLLSEIYLQHKNNKKLESSKENDEVKDYIDLDIQTDKNDEIKKWAYFGAGGLLVVVATWCIANYRLNYNCLGKLRKIKVPKEKNIFDFILDQDRPIQEKFKILDKMFDQMRKDVIGQEDAVMALKSKFRSIALGLNKKDRGIFFLAGPSGVGKTTLAKVLAKRAKLNFLATDFSTLTTEVSVSRLIGVERGYVGTDVDSKLASFIRENQKTGGVLLFDEFARAHPNVRNLFYKMFDEGELSLASGEVLDTSKFTIILTNNQGYEALSKEYITEVRNFDGNLIEIPYENFYDGYRLAFSEGGEDAALEFEKAHEKQLREILVQEGFDESLLARMKTQPFRVLKDNHIKEIIDLSLNELKDKMANIKGVNSLKWDDTFKQSFVDNIYRGYEHEGARKVASSLTDYVSEKIEKLSAKENSVFDVTLEKSDIEIMKKSLGQ